jgi:GDPmannose 4,6-dehydratase
MRALVIGGSGQDGVLLSAQLLAQGMSVASVSRRGSLLSAVENIVGDISQPDFAEHVVKSQRPDFIYYLAAFHRSSAAGPPEPAGEIDGCFSINTVAFASVLAAVGRHCPEARVLYASSCRIFGEGDGTLLAEDAPRRPVCPYGISKAAAMAVGEMFAVEKSLFVSSAILFNHESELRPADFVSKKLAAAAVAASRGKSEPVFVHSLSAAADWGAARDHTRAMIAILEQGSPGPWIVADGTLRTVADFAEACFSSVGLDWRGHVFEKKPDRPPRQWRLRGDSSRLRRLALWTPRHGFADMAADLVARTQRLSDARYNPADFHSHL